MPFTALELLTSSRTLRNFALANALDYKRTAPSPGTEASRWEALTSGIVRDRISGRGWEIGNLDFVPGAIDGEVEIFGTKAWVSGGFGLANRKPIRTGYLALTLARRLPHMILDAVGNDPRSGSSLTRSPFPSQRLSLEGDFNRHFTLYVPAGYERDALYVFTPDLMALLIDETGDLDVEVRDDRLLVWAPGGFNLRDPALWLRIERIMGVVGAKAFSQTDLYSDERVGDRSANVVAREGRRLRRRPVRGGHGCLLVAGVAFAGIAAVVLVFAALTFLLAGVVPLLPWPPSLP